MPELDNQNKTRTYAASPRPKEVAGDAGLRFMDPNSRGDGNLFRTLRGIEESMGQDGSGAEITRVVEAID